MLKFKDKEITENDYDFTVPTKKADYTFYSVNPISAIQFLKGSNLICMASYGNKNLAGNFYNRFTNIGYFKDIQDFYKSDKKEWIGIEKMYFKSVLDTDEAKMIIESIKSTNH
ncbi:hypothetical protein K8089_10120 [Aequorivita sp. F47161]|uniref:Uncharacterized protein n=1 Tax=Aequorivita vitellina TaxID=2874475 RepID=A0A9X1QX06_9FLAO|nr:hypothetical protein [Aequorivita vitellina]MCG2419379.1 hypothetical protein [Aequorivita vitellina]